MMLDAESIKAITNAVIETLDKRLAVPDTHTVEWQVNIRPKDGFGRQAQAYGRTATEALERAMMYLQ